MVIASDQRERGNLAFATCVIVGLLRRYAPRNDTAHNAFVLYCIRPGIEGTSCKPLARGSGELVHNELVQRKPLCLRLEDQFSIELRGHP